METFTLSHFPIEVRKVHIALFSGVTNAPQIRKRLIAAATREGPEGDKARKEVDFGFIEGSLIVSREHLVTAIQTTLLNALTPAGLQTRSHNIHSELLLSLSPNNNITDSIRRHGLSDKTTELIVVRIEPEMEDEKGRQEAVWGQIEGVVEGELTSLDELEGGELADWGKIDKIYKLSEMNVLKLPPTELLEIKKAAIVTAVAINGMSQMVNNHKSPA